MPDCLSAPYNGPYDCTNRWGLNCTNYLGFDFVSLWNITQLIQQHCPTDSRLFRTNNLPAAPESASLTLAACEEFAAKSWTPYPTSEIWSRLQTWKFPLFQLVASSPRPPLGLSAETFVLAHLMGDPIGSIRDLLRKLDRCEARAREFALEVEYKTQSSDWLRGCLKKEKLERVWKSLAIIVVSYDEWGEGMGNQVEEALKKTLEKLQGEDLKTFLKLCYNASDALAADRATAFLPIITAQVFFVGALAVAVFKTATITASSPINVSVEAHSIAFSSLYFWIIPAVFLASVIGVSQTQESIPRTLKALKTSLCHNDFLRELGNELPALPDIKERIINGGIYSWQPAEKALTGRHGVWEKIWVYLGVRENWLPLFTVASGTITAMLISGNVPAEGWQPRHCAYAGFLGLWLLSFFLTDWLKTSRPSLMWLSECLKILTSTWWKVKGQEEEKDQAYMMYRITLLKDLIVAIGTLGALMYVQVGPFNDCASYSLWGRKGLALPGRTDISNLLNERMRTTYPAIAFTSISIQLLLIPCIILYSHRKALHMLLQSDDGTSQWPNWLKLLRFRRRSARMSTILGRDLGSDEGEVAAAKDPDVELLPLKAVSDEAIGEITQCETLMRDFNRVSQSTGSSEGIVVGNLQHSRSLIQYDENYTRRRWTFLVAFFMACLTLVVGLVQTLLAIIQIWNVSKVMKQIVIVESDGDANMAGSSPVSTIAVLLIIVGLLAAVAAAFWPQIKLRMRWGNLQRRSEPERKCRVQWQCHCGSHLHDDFIELVPGAASDLAQCLATQSSIAVSDSSANYQEDVESQLDYSSKNSSLLSAMLRIAGFCIAKKDKSSEAAKSKREVRNSALKSAPSNTLEQPEQLYLLVCIERINGSVGLAQIDVCNIFTDKALFSCLRHQYRSIRGKWLSLLSFRCLQSINFVQFELWGGGSVDIKDYADEKMLPPATEFHQYKFDVCNTIPPIGPGQLLHLWNSPNHPDGTGQTVLGRFPKKKHERLYVGPNDTVYGWGIHLVEGPNWVLIWFIIFIVVLIGSCVFSIAYSIIQRDIQSAFAISSYVISFATLSIGACSICSRRMASGGG